MTIFLQNKTLDSPLATFPLVIGLKSDSHDRVERIIGDDMKNMANSHIPAFLGRNSSLPPEEITFSAMMFLSLGDQPERRGGNYLQCGNALTHTRWRVAGNLHKLQKVLPACRDCYARMRLADSSGDIPNWFTRHCDLCTNWMLGKFDHPLLKYDKPKKFPKNYLLGGNSCLHAPSTKINPVILSYNSLKLVVDLSHSKLVSGEWLPAESLCFLKENGINKDYRTFIVNQAKRCRSYVVAYKSKEDDPETYAEIESRHKKYPTKYCRSPIPSVWQRDLPLSLFVDTPMHLLFLGIAKSIFFKIGIWSGRCGRGPAFRKIAIGLLGELEALKLSWLTFNVKTFDSWGGWVSEKYQSLSCVALWVYGPLTIVDDVVQYTDPEGDVNKWLVNDYRKWLKVRGLPSNGKKQCYRLLFCVGSPWR
jgi:hypothetical protein